MFVVDGADRGRFEEAKAALDRALGEQQQTVLNGQPNILPGLRCAALRVRAMTSGREILLKACCMPLCAEQARPSHLRLPCLPAADPDLYGAPLLVLANKHDVVGAASPADMAEVFGLVQLSEMRPCSMQAVTARTGEGVKAAVQWLVENIKKSQRSELIRRRMLAQ